MPIRLLIIDDEVALAAALQLLLAPEFEVTPSYSGAEGIHLALLGHFDAIVCDICMPDVDGLGVYTELQLRKPGMERRLIFMTGGEPAAKLDRQFHTQPENGWLAKPFTLDELRSAVDHLTKNLPPAIAGAGDAEDDRRPTLRFKALPLGNHVFFAAAEALGLDPGLAREALVSVLHGRRVDPRGVTHVQILAGVPALGAYLRNRLPADETRDAMIGLRAYLEARNQPRPAAASRAPRVLVVEDDDDTRQVLTEVLEAKGFPVGAAREGREAMAILRGQLGREALPNVILCDLRMPVMDGWRFWEQLREHPVLSTIPVIVMSGSTAELGKLGDQVTGLAKPVDVQHLLSAIAAATG